MCPDSDKSEISEKLALLQERYFAQLPEKMAKIEAVWNKFDLQSTDQLSVLNELYRHVHNLMGSAGTFGAEQLSNAAKELQQSIRTVLDNENSISQEECDLIGRLISLVKKQSQMK